MRRATTSTAKARALALLLGAILVLVPLLMTARPARATTTFVVNLTRDDRDSGPFDGRCDVLPDRSGDQCTLRAAIEQANVTSGADVIHFSIPASGVQTIAPASQLPTIIGPVTIDGYTQPGTSPNTAEVGTNAVLRIVLSGANAGDTSGLVLGSGAGGTRIRGLVINGFARNGIALDDAAGNTGSQIAGNFIGTDASGTNDLGNAAAGIRTAGQSTANQIGGTGPEFRNLIAGNGSRGVILISNGNTVQGNLIGTKRNGTSPLGNGLDGVVVFNSNNLIGGNIAGAVNTIAFNSNDGVLISSGTGNRILRNSLFANGRLGINLDGGLQNAAGATANDPGDPDTGANTLQNKPRLDSAITTGAATTVQGVLNSTPNQSFVLRFFANPPGGNEGGTFLGQLGVTTNANGNAFFRFAPLQRVAQGQTITATATNAGGSTSEFSPPRTVESGTIGG